MEVITRKDARARGEKTYFTGVACKNGHVARRYVQSGTCSACIRASNMPVDDPNVEAKREAKSQLVQVKIRLYSSDLEVFKAAAHAMALARFPALTVGDVYPRLLPTDSAGGTALYKFNCHEADIDQIRGIASALIAAHPVAVPAWQVDRYIKVDPVPDWADRP